MCFPTCLLGLAAWLATWLQAQQEWCAPPMQVGVHAACTKACMSCHISTSFALPCQHQLWHFRDLLVLGSHHPHHRVTHVVRLTSAVGLPRVPTRPPHPRLQGYSSGSGVLGGIGCSLLGAVGLPVRCVGCQP